MKTSRRKGHEVCLILGANNDLVSPAYDAAVSLRFNSARRGDDTKAKQDK